MADLRRYVPGAALSWPGEDASRPVPLHRHVDGTLVFVDVSGFTALSEKLAQRGKVGAEQLTDVLNTVFGTMLGLAAARGGTLLKFGGDALFLLFTGEGHAVQASCAAVEMRTALAQTAKTPSPAGRLRLRMSVGVHTGLVDLFLVGTSHRELVVVGPATTAVAELEGSASASQILLGEQTAATLPSGAVGDALGAGRLLRWRRPHADHPTGYRRPDTDVDVARFVPTALRSFLASGDPESEHRTVGVSFVRYTGMDALLEQHGHQAAADALHTMVTSAQGCADAEGVTFLATDLAEDGGKIIMVAGFPTTAEDDQGRLLRASRRIITDSLAQEWPLAVRAGLNRGHVFAGAIGSFERATVTVMGDTVNLAARVMAKADPGTVLATPATLDNAQTLFATEPVEPFMVKGKSRPVTAYQVGEETGTRPPRGLGSLPFLGRDDELATIVGAIDALQDGTGSVITLVGETGIGKTRLMREALAARDTVPSVRARAEPYGAATPYRPLRDPLRHLLGIDHSMSGELSTWLRETVPLLVPDLAPWLPLIGDVLAIPVDETDATRDLDPQFRPDRTADAFVRLLEVLAGGPIAVVLDDAHYADDATATLLSRMERETSSHPWLLLTSRRAEDGGYRTTSGRTIELGQLDDDAVRKLVHEGTAAAPLRPHDVDAVVTRAAGNPLFVEETLANLREHGDLDALPSSLEGMVAAQIDALSPLARRVVRRASVLGRSFRVGVLKDLFADQDALLDDATLEELSDLLEPDGKGRLRFRHALIRDAAYASLPFRQRQLIHLMAAKSNLARARGNELAYADNLALHYWIGGDAEQTWKWARIAGRQARSAFANDDAAAQYQRALKAARRLPHLPRHEYIETCLTLGDVLEQSGRYPEALKAYGDARSAAVDAADIARVMARRAVVHDRLGQFSRALARSTLGLKAADSAVGPERTRLLAELWITRAAVYVKQERYQRAWTAAQQAESRSRQTGDPGQTAHALNLKAEAAHALGRPEAANYSREALQLLHGKGLLRQEAITTGTLGIIAFFQGRWDEASTAYRDSGAIFQRIGDLRLASTALANLVELLVLQKRHAEVDEAVVEAGRAFTAIGLPDGRFFIDALHARSLLDRGDVAAAEAKAKEAAAELRRLGAHGDALVASLVHADSLLVSGRPGEALDVLNESIQTYRGEWDLVQASTSLAKGRILATLGRSEEAEAELTAGLRSAQALGMVFEEAQLTLALNALGAIDPDTADQAQDRLKELGVRT